MSRLEQAKRWYEHPCGLPGGLNWLPLHHWIIGFPSLLGFDILTSSRTITLLFGVFTIPMFYYAVKMRFEKTIAIIASCLLTFNAFHIRYSVITMSEVPFIFFAITALFFFLKIYSAANFYT
jgi:4-amino-4-deoxy-L-arabinose transferase-like glycosyltransferase